MWAECGLWIIVHQKLFFFLIFKFLLDNHYIELIQIYTSHLYWHKPKGINGVFRKIPMEHDTWNIPGIFRKYSKSISNIIHRDISTEYLWNIQERFHEIFCKILIEYVYEIFYGRCLQSSRNISDMSIRVTFSKYSKNISMGFKIIISAIL